MLARSGIDTSSRAALRFVQRILPEASAVEEENNWGDMQRSASDPPTLRSARVIEGDAMGAVKFCSPGSRHEPSAFAGFLDGAQKVQVLAQDVGVPIVLGTVSAAIRVRSDRRLATWSEMQPRVERRIYLPRRYLALSPVGGDGYEVVDTAEADEAGAFPSQHPASLMERAVQRVQEDRERIELAMAAAWCVREKRLLFIDGGISGSEAVASSPHAVGVIKSHRTIYAEGADLRTVLTLRAGERSTVFRLAPRSRSPVLSWYLRIRANSGRDSMWGLVRVEAADGGDATARANDISRWIVAEGAPLALPDGRWDKMSYGIRNCEEYLRAIS